MGALQLPLSGLELVMFGSYQFKPPFPLQRCGSWIESYLGDLQSLDGTGRGGLRAPTHSSHHAPAPPFPPPPPPRCSSAPGTHPGPDTSSTLGPWMVYGPHYRKGRDLAPGNPELEEDMALT